MIRREKAEIILQTEAAAGIFSMNLSVSFASELRAGQFVSLFSDNGARLLPRPISVCDAFPEKGEIRLVYRVAGAGTEEFSKKKAGDTIDVMGPLGNGFPLQAASGKRVLLIGGGIGIPPMYFAGKMLLAGDNPASEVIFAAGYRSDDTFLMDEMKGLGKVLVSTDDGSLGTHGTVLDAIRENGAEADLIFACGPKVMLSAVKDYAESKKIPCYVSLEERMACGVGVCLGCVTKTTETDSHSMVKNRRICKDGPVFDAREVDLT